MELRSGRRLGSLPTPGPRRRRRPPASPDTDRISALPDEMLLHILARLRCARAAAHTSGLSRRWHGLWRHLPELSFRDISANALDAALGQVACPALSFLEVDMPEKHRVMDPARVSSLLRAAARLAPADLVFSLWGHCKDTYIPIEIPCFQRATSVTLRVWNLSLTLPAGGVEFPLLERLSVSCCYFDTAAMVLRCPRLRVFEVSGPHNDSVEVHSATIEELVVHCAWFSNIDISAPMLKRLRLSTMMTYHHTVSFSAPAVENLSWYCKYDCKNVGFGDKWRMHYLDLRMNDNVCVLQMRISADFRNLLLPASRSFSQEIAPLPAFSVLDLSLATKKHVFGALVSHLLGICSTIRSLQVDINANMGRKPCSSNCPCDQHQNWRNEIIPMTALEEVTVKGFGGTDHEFDFLKLLFRCAPLMKSMTVVLTPEFSPTSGNCVKIFSIFWENPDVKFFVYRSRCKHKAGSGRMVLHPFLVKS